MQTKARFPVRRAADLGDEELSGKRQVRAALEALPRAVLRTILERFAADGGPIPVAAVATFLPGRADADVRRAVDELDEKDLILVVDRQVVLAYPFAVGPNAFGVVFPDGRTRFAGCAVDALGLAPMLGHPVTVSSECHHCHEPLELTVRPDGPAGGEGVMVWLGERGEPRQRSCQGL